MSTGAGKFAIHDVVAGQGGPLHLPVPWATPEVEQEADLGRMRDALTEAGFAVLSWENKTTVAPGGAACGADQSPSGTPALGSFVLAGPGYPHAAETFPRNLREGRAGVVQVVATRR